MGVLGFFYELMLNIVSLFVVLSAQKKECFRKMRTIMQSDLA